MLVAAGEPVDLRLDAEPLAVESERAGIAVRQRMLEDVRVRLWLRRLVLVKYLESVGEAGDVVALRRLYVPPLRAAAKGRTAYPAGRSDLVP